MNLNYLNTFYNLIDYGSFSLTSHKLSISQPAVSMQIQKLEKELGTELIDHRKRKIVLTNSGKRLFRFADYLHLEQMQVLQDLANISGKVTGKLVIPASSIPGEFILPALLSRFKKIYSMVDVQLVLSTSPEVVDDLKREVYDIGFCSIYVKSKKLDIFKIGEDEVILIVYPEHPFANRDKVRLTELLGESIILREETSIRRQSPGTLLLKYGFDLMQCNPKLILGTNNGVVSAVEARTGIGFISNLAAQRSLNLGWIKSVKIEGVTLKRNFYCIYNKEKQCLELLSKFVAFVNSYI
jgi:DNA-binding transcriptional LysR family regulator